jgi:lysine 6-dehydrogenase
MQVLGARPGYLGPMSTYLVLGLGMQGTAAAHDLILRGGASRLLLVDADAERLGAAALRLGSLTGFDGMETHVLDAGDGALGALFERADLCMNCLPYRFSLQMTQLALDHGVHIADLGGNTAIVREQLALAKQHPKGGETAVLPDCGLMPGMGNLFAAHALAELGDCESIHIRCCGLPTDPKPPLDYMLLFNVNGLINEYFGMAQILRGGELIEVETFGELESIELPMPSGLAGAGRDFEAFITSGGLSTTPWTFEGRVQDLDYKTVRYAGHHAKFKLLKDLGLFGERGLEVPVEQAEGPEQVASGSRARVAPRAVLGQCLERALDHPGAEDLVFLRCTAVAGEQRLELEIFDVRDPETGFTAMERTTAYSATACLYGVLIGKSKIGAGPIEQAVDTAWYLQALGQRGIPVSVRRG